MVLRFVMVQFHIFSYGLILRNLSSCCILVEILPNALKRATISFRDSFSEFVADPSESLALIFIFMTYGFRFSYGLILSSSSENKIFKAVPRPVVCNLPQSLHFSQPTQSMILVMFLKWSLKSSFREIISLLCFSAPDLNMVVSSN